MAFYLSNKSRTVCTARNAEVAMELWGHAKWDIIICDYHLPGMNGVEFFRSLEEKFKATLKILISGFLTDEIRLDARDANVHAIIEKPFGPSKLISSLEKLIS